MKKDILGAGIIYHKKKKQIKFVLIKDRFNKWTFPKGHTLPKEKIKNTALRESSEETGLKNLKIKKYIAKIKYIADKKNKVVYFFIIESFDFQEKFIVDTKEKIKQAAWKKPEDVIKLLGYDNFTPPFKKTLKYLKII